MNRNIEAHIVDRLAGVYQPEEARLWLASPQPLLAGAVPAELIRSGRSEEVLRLVDQIAASVYR